MPEMFISQSNEKGFNGNLIYSPQISKGLSGVLIRSKSTVSIQHFFAHYGKNIQFFVIFSFHPLNFYFCSQTHGEPTCGSSSGTSCWTRSGTQAWSSGRTGQRGFSASSNRRQWHNCGARRRITAAWLMRSWVGQWGTAVTQALTWILNLTESH